MSHSRRKRNRHQVIVDELDTYEQTLAEQAVRDYKEYLDALGDISDFMEEIPLPPIPTVRDIFDHIVSQTARANYWRKGTFVEDTPYGELTFHKVGNNASHQFDVAYCEEKDVIILRSQDVANETYFPPSYSEHVAWPGYMGHW